jgi:hypothetical protein
MQRVIPAGEGIRILGFSPRVIEALRQFSIVQHREVDTSSPTVRVTSVRCARCGYEVAYVHETPADALRAVTMTHELSWETGQRCGGQMEFVAEPVERAVGVVIPLLR